MEKQFKSIKYLEEGNEKQRLAYNTLQKSKIFNILSQYNPVLVGTIPIDIDIASSDLDIICEVYDHQIFEKTIKKHYGTYKNFSVNRQTVRGVETSFSKFRYDGFIIEIFGQPNSVFKQNGYRHMIIEKKILDLVGRDVKEEIKKLKRSGIKTEPAFAKYLELKGDPFEELQNLSFLSEKELLKFINNRI